MTSRHDDVAEIKRLKARYFRYLDTKDWAGLESVLTPTAVLRWENPEPRVIEGRTAIVAMVRDAVGSAVTVHHGHMPEIDLTGDTTASGIWAMEDLIWWPAGHPGGRMNGFGHYHETYTRTDGIWRIATILLTRIRREVTTT